MKILLMGAGRMGSWFAREISKKHELAIYDRDEKKLDNFDGQIIKILRLEDLFYFDPKIVLNAVTLQETINAFEEIRPYIGKNAILSDIASIKGNLENYYEREGKRFVSMHPMFGPTFANMESLEGESVIFIKGSDKEGVLFFKDIFQKFGLSFYEYSFKNHDKMMAYSLSIPFIASLLFAACIEKSAVPGTTFARHLKIAKGLLSEENELLGEILFNPYTIPELEKITGKLEYLKNIIKGKDFEKLETFLNNLRGKIK